MLRWTGGLLGDIKWLANKECWAWVNEISPEKSTAIGYPIVTGQSWKCTYKYHYMDWLHSIYLCLQTHAHTTITTTTQQQAQKKRGHEFEREQDRMGLWSIGEKKVFRNYVIK